MAGRAGKQSARLPDHVRPGLRILFVGINPGLRSAEVGHHYAGHSNRFWKLLYDSGLVPEPVTYERDADLLQWGFGLTNLVLRATPGVADLTPEDFARGARTLRAKVRRLRPGLVALVGVTVFDKLYSRRATKTRVGLQPKLLFGSRIFVLPNPSGRNAHYSYSQMLRAFRDLAKMLERGRNSIPPRRARFV